MDEEFTQVQVSHPMTDFNITIRILLNKNNPHFNPNLEESAENPKLVPVTDREGISQEFHQAFTQIYKKQDVDDNAEAIQAFLESG